VKRQLRNGRHMETEWVTNSSSVVHPCARRWPDDTDRRGSDGHRVLTPVQLAKSNGSAGRPKAIPRSRRAIAARNRLRTVRRFTPSLQGSLAIIADRISTRELRRTTGPTCACLCPCFGTQAPLRARAFVLEASLFPFQLIRTTGGRVHSPYFY